MIVDEIDREMIVEKLTQCPAVFEAHIVKKFHVFENYFNSFGLVVIGKAMIFAAEDAEKALVNKLWAHGIWCGIQ
jgi:hypothetical protein